MSERIIPPEVRDEQAKASDPALSAFVGANAGSGKTYVLVRRVIRLLLAGVPPEKILCLTFTKAAAANMAKGVFDTLAAWTALGDAALDDKLRDLDRNPVNVSRRERARRLFAQALESPGGLKVQTIHAFCTRLLHQFPFEAEVAAGFSVLEEREETDLIGAVRTRVLIEATRAPDTPLGRALAKAAAIATDQTFAEVLRTALSERQAITHWLGHAGGLEAALAELARTLGVSPGDTEESVERDILDGSLLAAADLDAVIAAIRAGSPKDEALAERIVTARAASAAERIAAYFDVFFTGEEFAPRKALLTGPTAKANPALDERLRAESARLAPLIEHRRAVQVRDRTAALLTLASAVIEDYRAEKSRRGLLDYDDLIAKTRRLLHEVEAAWVHYKLDLGIDHVLIDEAQDTSPEQWDIIGCLVAEFTAGAGARTARRTIFAVGDDKQSIFSFQGAAPREFGRMRRRFRDAHEAIALRFETCRFVFSFRSGANVLGAVDRVFADPLIGASITDDDRAPPHEPLPRAAPGRVELWPLIEPEPRPAVEGWDAPFDAAPETSPVVRLARRIALTVKTWLTQGECIKPERPVTPRDILILVRQRGPVFAAVIRALKDADVPVAGADRMVLTGHIAVMDLLALADALLAPGDDLALATVLKSPLFGLSEEQLFTLAWNRPGTLRAALAARAGEAEFSDAALRFAHLEGEARRSTPFAFYGALLGADGGRARFLARLGSEASDALDEFLALALAFDARETPTVQGFAAWMRAAEVEIKRDMEMSRDEVRVMTAHGAKGLEAPIVFVADTTTPPSPPRAVTLLAVPALNAPPGTPDRLVWPGRKSTDPARVAAARVKMLRDAEDEYRRLLYVALTRAEQRLIVCGARGKNAPPKGCWYEMVAGALAGESVPVPAPYGEGEVLRWSKVPEMPVPRMAAGAATRRMLTMPPWLSPLRAQPPAPAAVTPSAPAQRRSGFDAEAARRRAHGRLVHRLMQSLPELAPERRVEAAWTYLQRAAPDFSEAERGGLATSVLSLLNAPKFGALFAAGSRAEAPIIGAVSLGGEEVRVSGQIDRLVVSKNEVLIADYKTDRAPPATADDVPQAYVRQMALYRAVLAQVFPGRPIRTALLWTETAVLMELDENTLDSALKHQAVRAA